MPNKDYVPKNETDTGIQVQPGVPLVDKDGNYIGKVKAVNQEKIVVDRSAQHCADLRVPFEAVEKAGPGQIRLRFSEKEIDQQGW